MRGAHARSAVGMAELPFGIPVEIEAEVAIHSGSRSRLNAAWPAIRERRSRKSSASKPETASLIVGARLGYQKLLAPLPADVRFADRLTAAVELPAYPRRRRRTSDRSPAFRKTLKPTAIVWVSWPKKSSGVPTEISEDTVRSVALPLGFVDVKVCVIDDVWSGLKLVVRTELR